MRGRKPFHPVVIYLDKVFPIKKESPNEGTETFSMVNYHPFCPIQE